MHWVLRISVGHIYEPCKNCCNDRNAGLGGKKGIQPVKTEWRGTDVVVCLKCGANDLHMVQLMPLSPHHQLLH